LLKEWTNRTLAGNKLVAFGFWWPYSLLKHSNRNCTEIPGVDMLVTMNYYQKISTIQTALFTEHHVEIRAKTTNKQQDGAVQGGEDS